MLKSKSSVLLWLYKDHMQTWGGVGRNLSKINWILTKFFLGICSGVGYNLEMSIFVYFVYINLLYFDITFYALFPGF